MLITSRQMFTYSPQRPNSNNVSAVCVFVDVRVLRDNLLFWPLWTIDSFGRSATKKSVETSSGIDTCSCRVCLKFTDIPAAAVSSTHCWPGGGFSMCATHAFSSAATGSSIAVQATNGPRRVAMRPNPPAHGAESAS